MNLLELVSDHHRIISVIGMAKNAGKTVALNELIAQASEHALRLGLTSIGRDGEKVDVVTCTDKPTIHVESGTLLATAEGLFDCSEARLELLEITDYGSSMGRILIARAISSGNVQLAGPCTNSGIRDVSERMLSYGARLVLVDGALDRVSSASPAIADAALLSTGAVLSRDMSKVIEQTVHRVRLFQLAAVKEPWIKGISDELGYAPGIVLIEEHEHRLERIDLPVKTALNSGKIIGDAMNTATRYVIISGALVTKTLMDVIQITRTYKHVIFVVRDATRIFIDHRDWLHFQKLGINVQVADPVDILAVTVNPYAPTGYFFEPRRFLEELREFLNPVPVFDVVHGGES